jgi:hypothetical protein
MQCSLQADALKVQPLPKPAAGVKWRGTASVGGYRRTC